MKFRLTPQLIRDLLTHHAGIATPDAPCVLSFGTPPLWHSVLFGPFAALRFRPLLLALDGENFVLVELTMRLNVRQLRRLPLAEIRTAVLQKALGSIVLIVRLKEGEKLSLRIGNKVVGFPPQKSNLAVLLSALEERGLLRKSTSHLKMLAAGVVFGLLALGVAPSAIRYWFQTQTQAEQEAIRRYLEASRETRPEPRNYAAMDVLLKIESYQAPPIPQGAISWLIGNGETYDARLRSGNPVPPTLSETLAEDVTILLKRFYPESLAAGEAEVRRALGLYLHVPWTALPGYRPWTHWNFVRTLDEAERNTLARQLARRLIGWKGHAAGPS